MNVYTLLLTLSLTLLASLASAQEDQVLPGTPDRSTVPVKDNKTATADDSILKMVLSTKERILGEAVAEVQIGVYDVPTGKLIAKGTTDEFGFVTLRVPFDGSYKVETCTPRYLSRQASINDCGSDGEPSLMCVQGLDFFTYDDALAERPSDHILKADFVLDALKVGEVIDLDKIYYDFDKATLRPESKAELDQLVRALEMLPSLKIQLRSHTDSRGTNEYNEDLSQRRAESVVEYLIAEGISADRFGAKGFGESRLINECADGVDCSEEEHQANRRTEFEITSYEPQPCAELPEITAMVKSSNKN